MRIGVFGKISSGKTTFLSCLFGLLERKGFFIPMDSKSKKLRDDHLTLNNIYPPEGSDYFKDKVKRFLEGKDPEPTNPTEINRIEMDLEVSDRGRNTPLTLVCSDLSGEHIQSLSQQMMDTLNESQKLNRTLKSLIFSQTTGDISRRSLESAFSKIIDKAADDDTLQHIWRASYHGYILLMEKGNSQRWLENDPFKLLNNLVKFLVLKHFLDGQLVSRSLFTRIIPWREKRWIEAPLVIAFSKAESWLENSTNFFEARERAYTTLKNSSTTLNLLSNSFKNWSKNQRKEIFPYSAYGKVKELSEKGKYAPVVQERTITPNGLLRPLSRIFKHMVASEILGFSWF